MRRALFCLACLIVSPAMADTTTLKVAQDRYEVGDMVRFDGPSVVDLFLAGNRVTMASAIDGSAHMAGRRVTIDAAVAGNVFAAGYAVSINAPVEGNVTAMGYEVLLNAIKGNLRATGAEVSTGAVGGYALITGGDVTLRGPISGDAVLVAGRVAFEPGATVAGTLTIYVEDPAKLSVPTSVAPVERVKVQALRADQKDHWTQMMSDAIPFWRLALGFIIGVLISGLIATLVIAIAPNETQSWRELAMAHPGRAVWFGFLVTSALAGSGFVLMLTLIGIFLLPVMLVITGLAIWAGYTLGSYVLGAWLWTASGRIMPAGLLGKFGLACLGAFITGLAWLIPIAGWFFVLGLTLLGIGTLAAFLLPEGIRFRRVPAPAQASQPAGV